MVTSFTPTLERLLRDVPDTMGAIFAARDGEAVDQVVHPDPRKRELEPYDVQVLGAHFGVILNQVQNLLRLYHFGEAQAIVVEHEKMVLFLHSLRANYFLVLVAHPGVHLAKGIQAIRKAAAEVNQEL